MAHGRPSGVKTILVELQVQEEVVVDFVSLEVQGVLHNVRLMLLTFRLYQSQ